MKKYLPFLLILLLLFVSCEKEQKRALNIAISQEPVTLDTMVNTTLTGRIIANGNIYEKLLTLDGEGSIRPELALSYTLEEGGTVLRFVLRQDVVFHDGTPLTAEDAAASMNRWLRVYAQAQSAAKGNQFQVTGKYSLELRSDSSLALLVYMIAESPQSAIIMPKRLAETEDTLVAEVVGTGPYILKEWRSGELIELEANSKYVAASKEQNGKWGEKKATLETLRYYFVSDSVTRLLGLASGEYDFINDVMSDDRAGIVKNDKLRILEGEESGLIALVFNKKEGPTTDVEVRKAISYVLDSLSLMRSCYGDYGYSIHSDYMEKEQLYWKTTAEDPYASYEPEKAKEILRASSYNGEPIRILTSNLSNLDRIAEDAASKMEAIGMKTELIVCDWATMTEKRKDPSSWDIFVSAFSQVTLPTMKSFLNPDYPGWIDRGSLGYQMVEEMSVSKSLEEARDRWQEAQKILYEEIPAYIPGHYSTAYASSSKLEGVILQNGFFFWNADLKP
ncbi:MAG: hypothetical protein KBS81_09260 [Spirochaetales bacterium]|nr:hypothetical protein [Candidatus Physcosoma equi]